MRRARYTGRLACAKAVSRELRDTRDRAQFPARPTTAWQFTAKRTAQIDYFSALRACGKDTALAVWDQLMQSMPGEKKVAKAFELTELTHQLMRAGIRRTNPDATETEIHEMYVDRLLQYHGTSLA
ncbi:MAG: hypothetical protein R6U98_00120, partial [Pirellulaceae bacterium]